MFDKKLLRAQLIDSRSGTYRSGAVTYTPDGYAGTAGAIAFGEMAEVTDIDGISAWLTAYVERHWRDFFLTKTDDWEAESEYRVLFEPAADIHLGRSERVELQFGSALRAVILGSEFPTWMRRSAYEVATREGVELHSIRWGYRPQLFPLDSTSGLDPHGGLWL